MHAGPAARHPTLLGLIGEGERRFRMEPDPVSGQQLPVSSTVDVLACGLEHGVLRRPSEGTLIQLSSSPLHGHGPRVVRATHSGPQSRR